MRGDARLTRAINRSLMGWWKHDQEQGDAALLTLMSSPREGTEGTSRTLHPRGHASRPGSPGVRVSEGHLWVDPINEIEIAQRFIPRLNHHQNNLSSHLHRPQHPASYLVRNDNLPNARPSS